MGANKPAAKKQTPELPTSGWIVREVSFATYKKEDQAKARRLTESLTLLEKGVESGTAGATTVRSFNPIYPTLT